MWGGCVAGALTLGLSLVGGSWLGRPSLPWLGILCVGLFIAYTLPPLRLNYRGGGELLEAAGVGFALPIWHLYAQAGTISLDAMMPLWGFASMALGSAVASGLSDEVSERKGGKRTVTTSLGNRVARRVVEAAVGVGGLLWLLAAAVGAWPAVSPLEQTVSRVTYIVAGLVVMAHLYSALRVSTAATTSAFDAQKQYKKHLHRAIWRGTTVLAIGLVVGVML